MSVSSLFKRLLPSTHTGTSVPPMDGVFKPNNRLEEAESVVALPDIDNLAATPSGLVYSAGSSLFLIATGSTPLAPRQIVAFAGPISFVAANAAGQLAVGVEGGGIHLGDMAGGFNRLDLNAPVPNCATAAVFDAEGTLFVCIGSSGLPASEWKRDLMTHGASGALVAVDVRERSTRTLAGGLAFPYGAAVSDDGRLVVSESWRHRIVGIDPRRAARPDVLLDDLPAYPSRLVRASDGGYWLAFFAPRRQLTEMVLREDDYRKEMIATIEPSDWIGPELSVGGGVDQPLQMGSVRQMGVLKPWAPSRFYGLIAKCDAKMKPTATLHSRADGARHGTTSVAEQGANLFVASRGAGALLRAAANGFVNGGAGNV
jgi:Strictosidine synthase